MEGEVIRKKGPKAVIDCKQDIPCNPCTTCCAFKAITFAGSISSLPELDEEKCIGCGICFKYCPANAISEARMKTKPKLCISCMRCVSICSTESRKVPMPMRVAAHATLKKLCSTRKEPAFYI